MAAIDRITELDMRSSPSASIPQLGAAAYRQNAPGNKPRPLRKKKNSGIRNYIAVGTGAEGMNLVEVLANEAGLGLLGTPRFRASASTRRQGI
jgi:hypothetical protein